MNRHSKCDFTSRSRLLLAMCLFFASSAGSALESKSNVIGRYHGVKCPKGYLSCVSTTKSDSLMIERLSDDQLQLTLSVAFDQGHSCNLTAKGVSSASDLEFQADGLERGKPCVLRLKHENNLLISEDVEQLCRAVYCGARGTLDGLRFSKKR